MIEAQEKQTRFNGSAGVKATPLCLSPDLVNGLDAEARRRQISRSAMAREAVRSWLSTHCPDRLAGKEAR